MNTRTVCIPVNADGTIHDRLGKAPVAVVCQVRDDAVVDWVQHDVHWDQTYGVDVMGVHHPRVIRFLQEHQVDTVVADNVCDGMMRVFDSLGITLYAGVTGDARTAVLGNLRTVGV